MTPAGACPHGEVRRISKSKSPIPSRGPRFLRKEAEAEAPPFAISHLHFTSLPSPIFPLRSLQPHSATSFNFNTSHLASTSLLHRSLQIPTATQQPHRRSRGQNPSHAQAPPALPLAALLLCSGGGLGRLPGTGSGARDGNFSVSAGAGAGGPGGGGAGRDGAQPQRHAAAARGKLPALRALHLLRWEQGGLRPRALLLRHQLQHPQPPLRVLLLHAQVLRLPRMQPLTRLLLLLLLYVGFIKLIRVRVREWGSKEYV
ncbi:unnamed protein product [Urochloa humidicola]